MTHNRDANSATSAVVCLLDTVHTTKKWLNVDPRRWVNEFVKWCEQRGFEVFDTAGKVKDK